ncbi:MAG: hypothetical protein Q8R18_00990 [bacterium]|nr:hypothetical protein [bacterium]
MTLTLSHIIEQAEDFTQREIHCKPEQSKIKIYSQRDWQEFCKKNNFEQESHGLYIPQRKRAYLQTESPFFITNLFHEYFGHGLFYEHSLVGKELEKILENGEGGNTFLQQRRSSSAFGLGKTHHEDYEGFALWLEAKLCNELGYQELWERREKTLPEPHRIIYNFFTQAEQKFTPFGFLAQLGFPKYYHSDKIKNFLQAVYQEQWKNIDMALLYGSQKPYSDMDLFVVSNNSRNFFNGWLDIYELERTEFHYLLERFDISVTEAISTGTPIHGENMWRQAQEQIKTQHIKKNAARHNRRKAEELREKTIFTSEREKRITLSYEISYRKAGEFLTQGNRVLGKRDLFPI